MTSAHGTVCAISAIWGAPQINFADIRFWGTTPGAAHISGPFKWAACDGTSQAKIISFSVNPSTWLGAFATFAATLPETLFLVPGGNTAADYTRANVAVTAPYKNLHTALRAEDGAIVRLPPNVIIVGGVGRDLKHYDAFCGRRGPAAGFGTGELVELNVPADYSLFWFGPKWASMLQAKNGDKFEDITAKGFKSMQGTSMATPLAANVAAKCLLICPGLKAPQLKKVLLGASNLRYDAPSFVNYELDVIANMVTFKTGGGVLDPAAALASCKTNCDAYTIEAASVGANVCA